MSDEAKTPVPHSTRAKLRKALRTAWTGAVALAMVGGVLLTASASVPSGNSSRDGGDLPIRLYGLLETLTVGETESAPEGVTLAQIVAVLQRAEEESHEQGPNFSPAIAQAAAELGMLYTTYQMQQLSFGENNKGLRIEDAPIAGEPAQDDAASSTDEDTSDKGTSDKNGSDKKSKAADENDRGDKDKDKDKGKDEKDADEKGAGDKDDDAPSAVQVSQERASEADPHSDDPHFDDPQSGYVTYDQLVIAAVRLANMLDPSVPNALVEVDGADQQQGFSLRRNLLDTVAAHGGSTAGYANGRIPTDVLCPLAFAPGHMLRCDAAERLTALNEQYEAEFGTPIPMTDSYRSYELQVAVAASKPHLAAIPGTSNHGWGLAVDLGNPIAGGNSPQYVWMRVHGPDYGWDNPSWAQLDGEKPEPWHFEFFAAGSIPNRAIDTTDVGTWEPTDSASPHYKPAYDPKPKDKASDGSHSKPSHSTPSKKPTKPAPKPGSGGDDGSSSGPKPPGSGGDPKPPGGGGGGDDGDGDGGGGGGDDGSGDGDSSPSPSPSKPAPSPSPSCPDESTEPPCPDDEVDPECPIEGEEPPTCPCPSDGSGSESDVDADGKSTTDDAATEDSESDDETGAGDETDEPDPCSTDGPEGPTPTPSASSSTAATLRDDEVAPDDKQAED